MNIFISQRERVLLKVLACICLFISVYYSYNIMTDLNSILSTLPDAVNQQEIITRGPLSRLVHKEAAISLASFCVPLLLNAASNRRKIPLRIEWLVIWANIVFLVLWWIIFGIDKGIY